MVISAFFQGAALGLSMIVPIGAQNSFILTQGIRRNFHFHVATICLLCDVILTILGVFGVGVAIASNDVLFVALGGAGVAFLITYASISFYRAIRGNYTSYSQNVISSTLKTTVITTLAVTLLNPHVYLDTVVILGSVASTFSEASKVYFTAGAILAAAIWFYALAASAAMLSPWLSKPKVQRAIDILVGSIMYYIAYGISLTLLAQL